MVPVKGNNRGCINLSQNIVLFVSVFTACPNGHLSTVGEVRIWDWWVFKQTKLSTINCFILFTALNVLMHKVPLLNSILLIILSL